MISGSTWRQWSPDRRDWVSWEQSRTLAPAKVLRDRLSLHRDSDLAHLPWHKSLSFPCCLEVCNCRMEQLVVGLCLQEKANPSWGRWWSQRQLPSGTAG